MTNSQNGWPVLDRADLVWFDAAGGRFAAPNQDVALVAAHLITRFDAEVEPIAGPVLDDWSYAPRLVRGSSSVISNHASATAWDLNATRHPRSVHATFTTDEIAAVRRILDSILDHDGERIFRWGNDYVTATIDAMHFEINATRIQVTQAVDRLRAHEKENDMKWTDKIPLTAKDAEVWGTGPNGKPYREGDLVTFGAMVRYPTLARKLEQELAEFAAQSAARHSALLAAVRAIDQDA